MESVHLLQARTSSHRAASCSGVHSQQQQPLHHHALGAAPLASGPVAGLSSRGGHQQGARVLLEPALGARASRPHNPRGAVVASALFSPPAFQPDKLTVFYIANDGSCSDARQHSATEGSSSPGRTAAATQNGAPGRLQRRYTLTHNDLTGALKLTVGERFNQAQISGFYTRLLRDEVVAEWRTCSTSGQPSLHVYCHVSGEERWLAPPQLRNYIFRRELPLVLDTFLYADRELLQQQPELASAEVFVHFQSCREELDVVERWGILGQRSTWQPVPRGLLQRLMEPVFGAEQVEQQQGQQWQPGQGQGAAPAGRPSSMLLQPASTDGSKVQPPGSGAGAGAGVDVAPMASAAASRSGACLCSSEEEAREQQLLASGAAVACQCEGQSGAEGQLQVLGARSSTSRPAEAGPVGAHQHRQRRKPRQQSSATAGVVLLQQQQAQAALQVPTQQQQEAQQQGPAVAPAASWASDSLSPSRLQGPQGADAEAASQAATSSSNGSRGAGGNGSASRQAWQQPAPASSPLGTAMQEQQQGLVAAVPVPVDVASSFVVLDRLAAASVPVAAGTAVAAAGGRVATPVGR